MIIGCVTTQGDPDLGSDPGCGNWVLAQGDDDDGRWHVPNVLMNGDRCRAAGGDAAGLGTLDRPHDHYFPSHASHATKPHWMRARRNAQTVRPFRATPPAANQPDAAATVRPSQTAPAGKTANPDQVSIIRKLSPIRIGSNGDRSRFQRISIDPRYIPTLIKLLILKWGGGADLGVCRRDRPSLRTKSIS